MYDQRIRAALLLLCCCCLTACGGGRDGSPTALLAGAEQTQPATLSEDAALLQEPAALAGLPPLPLEAPRSSSAPPSDADRLCLGEEWENALASNKVAGDVFSPEFAGAAGRDLSDAAYAIFRFSNLAEYTGKKQLVLGWSAAGDTPQDVRVALSNYALGRWEWHSMPAGMKLPLSGFADYVSPAGNTFALVVSLDNGNFILDYVLAGGSTLPQMQVTTDLDPDPLKNIAPRVVSFNATASRSYGGSLTGFDFDWEGDGVWDLENDPDGLGIHQFQAGNYETRVRVTDNLGQQAELSIIFTVIDPDNQPPTASFTRTPTGGDGPLTVQFDASGSFDGMGGYITRYEWDFADGGGYEYVSDSPEAEWTFTLAGANQVTLRVTDNYLATHSVTLPVTLSKGWRTQGIVGNMDTRYRLAMCTSGSGVDARACVAFFRFDAKDLCFVRAITANGSTWAGYSNPVSTALDTGFSPSMDVLPGGIPIIAYGQAGSGGYDLYCVSADDFAATGWSAPSKIDAGNNYGIGSSLRVINTIPCVAVLDPTKSSGTSYVLYFQANDGMGTTWKQPQIALMAAPGFDFESVTLGRASDGLFRDPIIAAGYRTGLEYKGTCFTAATNIDGTSWDAPAVRDGWTSRGNFVDVNGRPAYAGCGLGQSDPAGYFIRSLDGDGDGWPAEQTGYADSSIANVCLVVDGRPEIYYQDEPTSRLLKVRAGDDDATAWGEPELVWNYMGEYACELNGTVVNGKPVLAYVYWNGSTREIRCLSWY
ncbi:MAG: PKD domain-containing protein [bacterium]